MTSASVGDFTLRPPTLVTSRTWRLAVADLAHDGHVGRHAKEAGDQATEIDLTTLLAARASLH
ncbi:MAG: hypothetical protein M3133_06910, partial [Actinomycetota bacterium]|nr:hypothetical protein [Actinomycetota bacterium]